MTRFATLTLLLLLALPASAQDALRVFVGNQGGGGVSASVTSIAPGATEADQLLEGQLGGFLQGMAVIGDRLYVTGNGTRVDVLDTATGQRVGQIEDATFTAARYIAEVSGNRAYITTQNYSPDATTSDVVIVDLATNAVTGRIAMPVTVMDIGFPAVFGNPEGLVVVDTPAGERAYISQAAFGQGDEIAVVDTATDTIVGTIATGCTARYPLAVGDAVLVPCANGTEMLAIDISVDPLAIAERVDAPDGLTLGTGFAQDATVAPAIAVPTLTGGAAEVVYIIAPDTGIAVFDPSTSTFLDTISIPEADSRGIVALGVDPGRNTLYLGRPDPDNAFSAAGTVTVHAASGALQATYDAGVYPSFVSVDLGSTVTTEPLAEAGLRVSTPAPNPAVSRTTLTIEAERPAEATLAVFDALGREVSREQRALPAGSSEVSVDATVLPAGVYVVRIETPEGAAMRRLTIAR